MKITIVTTMRNEGPHIVEWVAHHMAAGVTDFLVYTNDCTDGTDHLLDAIPGVTHIALPAGDKPPQWRALKRAWDHELVQNSDWVLCIDCDEFLNINNRLSGLVELIHEVGSDAIVLPWRLFGSSDRIDFDADLTQHRFRYAAPEEMLYPPLGSYFKTLFRRDGPFRGFGVHRPKQKNAKTHGHPKWIDGSGREIDGHFVENDSRIMAWGGAIARDLVQLNHYSTRSVAEFMIKRDRGLPNHTQKDVDLTYWVERNFNTVRDETILSMTDKTRIYMDKIRREVGVRDAERATLSWHKARLQQLLKQPAELALYGRLILAGSSVPPDRKRSLALIEAYQVAHE